MFSSKTLDMNRCCNIVLNDSECSEIPRVCTLILFSRFQVVQELRQVVLRCMNTKFNNGVGRKVSQISTGRTVVSEIS